MAVQLRPYSLGVGSYNGIGWGRGTWLQVITYDGLEETPSIRSQDTDRAEGQGTWSGPDRMGGRNIVFSFAILGTNNEDLRQKLWQLEQAFVVDGIDRQLWLYDSSRYLMARVRRRQFAPALGGRGASGKLVVQFYAPYPLYRGIQNSHTVGLATATGGLSFPLPWPLVFGTVVGGTMIHNYGNLEAPVVIQVPGPAINPAISNDAYNASIVVNITLVTGDLLVIDTDARTVTLGGQSRDSQLSPWSNWWNLLPGDNLIRYTSGSAAPGEGATVLESSVWG
jgi:Phage tail protein